MVTKSPINLSLFIAILLLILLATPYTTTNIYSQGDSSQKKERKTDSNLDALHREWLSHQNSRSQAPFAPSDPTVPVRAAEYVVVDATAATSTATLRNDLIAEGMKNVSVFGKVVSGEYPIDKLDGLIDKESLKIMRPAYAITHVGLVDSQGDVAMRTDIAKNLYGLDGSGITVGTLSDSYDCLNGAATDVANGDLPAGIILLDDSRCPGSDEGRGMMQLIADVAPGAGQAFHTAFGGMADFANGIIELEAAGADVIVDDVFYFAEPFFQDGIIAQAVDQVYALGVPYFSSAGNSARKSYEDAFRDSGVVGPLAGGVLHDFDAGSGVDAYQRVTIPNGATVRFSFQWDQPFFSVSGAPGSTNDIDIAILNTSGEIVARSWDNNIGGDPLEIMTFTNNTGNTAFDLIISRYSGSAPGLMKYIAYGTIIFNEFDTASGTVVGHANAAHAQAVGAAYYLQTPPFGTSPAQLESFSSGGSTPILFDLSGNSINVLRDKPEIVAPDGTNTTFFGSDSDGDGWPNFFGTSAAAPHAAAATALMLEQNSLLSPQMVYDILEFGAADMGITGFDLDTGHGLIEVDAAIAEARLVTSQFGDKPTEQIVQLGPNTNINETAPTFEWSALPDATGYQLVLYNVDTETIAFSDRYTNEEANCLGDSACAIQPSITLDPGSYRWLVRAYNFYGDGPWSQWP